MAEQQSRSLISEPDSLSSRSLNRSLRIFEKERRKKEEDPFVVAISYFRDGKSSLFWYRPWPLLFLDLARSNRPFNYGCMFSNSVVQIKCSRSQNYCKSSCVYDAETKLRKLRFNPFSITYTVCIFQ